MEFQELGALERLAHMTDEECDALPFGVVGLDRQCMVTTYNLTEQTMAGLSPERVMGLDFFNEVAPCMNNFMVAQRLYDEPALDAEVPYILTLKMRPTKVRLRLLKSESHSEMFVLIDRREAVQ